MPDTLKAFVDSRVLAGGHSAASAYICELIRADPQKKVQQQLERLLFEGLESGEPLVVDAPTGMPHGRRWRMKHETCAYHTGS